MTTLVHLPRILRIPVATVIAAGAIALIYPGGLMAAWTDLRDYAKVHREMEDESRRDNSLKGTSDQLANRLQLKEGLVRDLIANRIDLTTTAEQFLVLWADDTDAMRRMRQRYAGSTDLERACRNVIEYSQAHRPSAAVQARFDHQFRSRFGQSSRMLANSPVEVSAR